MVTRDGGTLCPGWTPITTAGIKHMSDSMWACGVSGPYYLLVNQATADQIDADGIKLPSYVALKVRPDVAPGLCYMTDRQPA